GLRQDAALFGVLRGSLIGGLGLGVGLGIAGLGRGGIGAGFVLAGRSVDQRGLGRRLAGPDDGRRLLDGWKTGIGIVGGNVGRGRLGGRHERGHVIGIGRAYLHGSPLGKSLRAASNSAKPLREGIDQGSERLIAALDHLGGSLDVV